MCLVENEGTLAERADSTWRRARAGGGGRLKTLF